MPWIGQYILDANGNPQPCEDTFVWGEWYEKPLNRRVAWTDLQERGCVSTIFLALDLDFNPMDDPLTYRPILWETMVFGGPLNKRVCRYRSRQDAEAGHAEMVKECMDAILEEKKS